VSLYEEGLFDDDAIRQENHWHDLDMADEAARNQEAAWAEFKVWADGLLSGLDNQTLFGLHQYLTERLTST
jgi:hypothetical protein